MRALPGFKVWHRLLAAGFMLCVPLAMLVYFLVEEQNVGAASARKEITGVEHVTAVSMLVDHLQRHRGLVQRVLQGDRTVDAVTDEERALVERGFAEIVRIERRHGDALRVSGRRAALQERWKLLSEEWRGLDAGRAWDRHSALVEDALDLVRHLANTSGLITDPALDSYYLMDIVVNRTLGVAGLLGETRGLGAGAAAAGRLDRAVRDRLLVSYARLKNDRARLHYALEIAMDANPSLRAIEQPHQEWEERYSAYLETVEKHLLQPGGDARIRLDAATYFAQATVVIEGTYGLFGRTAILLTDVLESRIARIERNQRLLLTGALAAFAMAVALGMLLVGSVTRPLARAVAVFHRIENGQYDSEIDTTTGGEPLALLRSLAAMQEKLRSDRVERERAQEELRAAHDELELRVDERTSELTAANAQLVQEAAERKRAEDELRESEGRFRDFSEATSDWFWEMDEACRFSYFSGRFGEITGVRPEDLLGKTREETGIPDVDAEAWRAHLSDLAAHRPFRDFQHSRNFPGGRTAHLSINGKPVFDDDGTFLGYRGTGSDVTERKRAEDELRASEIILATAQRVAKVGSWRWSIVDDALISCSDEYARIHGVGPDEIHDLMARQMERVIHPDDRERVETAFRRFDEAGGDFEIEYRIVRSDGEVRHVVEIGKEVLDDSGRAIEQIGTVQDITARKQAEERATEAHAQLIDAIESISDGFILFDADDRLVLCNSRFREFYADIDDLLVPGAAFDDLIDASVERGQVVVPLDDGNGWIEMRRDQFRTGRGTHEQLLAGGRWVMATEHKTSSGGVVGIRSDITERRRTDEALRESRRRLTNAQRIARLGHWDLDLATDKLFWSDELFKIFGVARKDFDGTTKLFYQRVHADDLEMVERSLAEALERKQSYSIEFRIVLPDGSTRFVREDGEVVVDDHGKPLRWSGTVQDITERKAAEERFRMLLEAAPDAMIIVDKKGIIVLVNAQTETLFGHDRADLVGKKIEMLMPKGFRTQHRKHRTGYFGDPHLRPMGQALELSGLARDGSEFPVEISLSPIETPEGMLVSAAVRDITERKLAEVAIRESEARLAQAGRVARLGHWWWQTHGERLQPSPEMADIFGVPVEDLAVSDEEFLQFVHPDDRDQEKLRYGPDLTNDEPYGIEYRIIRPDGELRHIFEIGEPNYDERGHLVGEFGTVQDITERKQAEQALRDSARGLAAAQRVAHLGNWEWDIASGQLQCSDEFYRIFGVAPEEFDANNEGFYQYVHPDDRAFVEQCDAALLANGEPLSVDYRIVRSDGAVRTLHASAEAIRDEAGVTIRINGTFQDITERKQAEEALRESEQRFRVFMDNSPAAISLKDAEGRYRLVNKRFEDWYGLRTDDVLGKTVSELFPNTEADVYEASEREVLETAKMVELEYETDFADGTRHQLAISKFPVFDADGRPVGVGTMDTDVTDQRQTETQLRQAQKMEAVGQLTGGIAHDFNNLLAVIAGNLELLDETVEGQPEAQELLRWAIDAADDAATLTQRLLAFSRRQPLQPRVVEVNDMVHNLLNLLRRALGEAVEIRTALADDPWPTMADASQLESALLNLVLNARDALPADGSGSVTIESTNAVLDEDYANDVDEVEPGDYVVLTVSDTGRGMAAEVLDHAFEPFFTTKGVGEGSGLGLSMVYGFAQQSGGHAKIYSEEGHGTAVKLYLPRATESERPAEAPARQPEVRGEGEKVLVVEDDDKVRDLAVKVITSLGYSVSAAADGAIALDIIEKAPDIDVMLTDVILPGGMSGRELAEEVATRRPELKVIYTSGYSANVITHNGKLDEGVELLSKPYRREALAQALRKALGAGAG